jgi:hypothetical protein
MRNAGATAIMLAALPLLGWLARPAAATALPIVARPTVLRPHRTPIPAADGQEPSSHSGVN